MNRYEENFTSLRDLNEGDVSIDKAGCKAIYVKSLGDDKHLLKSLETGNLYEVPHGRFPVFKEITTTPAKKLHEELLEKRNLEPVIIEPKRIDKFYIKFPKELPIDPSTVISINKPKWENDDWTNIEIIINDHINPSNSWLINEFIGLNKGKENKSPIFDIRIISLDPTSYPIEEWYIGVEKIVSVDYSNEPLNYYTDKKSKIQTIKLVLKPSKCILLY